MIATIVLYSIMLAFSVAAAWKRKSLLKGMGFERTSARDVGSAFGYFFLMLGTTILLGMLFSGLGMAEDLEKVPRALKGIGFGEIIATLTIASFVEEIFFRGFLQRRIGLVAAAFIFAYFHIIYGSLTEIIGTFALGAILGLQYSRSKNLFSPILSHLIYDLFIVTVVFAVA